MRFYSVTHESAGLNEIRTHDARYCINMLDLKTPKMSGVGVFMYFILRDVLKPALYGPQSCT